MADRIPLRVSCFAFALFVLAAIILGRGVAQEPSLPKLFKDDFESGTSKWETLDKGWKVATLDDGRKVLSQHTKKSDYGPPFRSPLHIALAKDLTVSDFQIDVQVRSTHKDYGHRDVCLFFGFQDPAQFYYVHLGKQTDPHANQIFIVNKADRTKISLTTNKGTPWDENWHRVRITRNVESGDIKVFFDNMSNPAMTACDKTFTWGRVGIGSFDDTSNWDDFVLRGKRSKPQNNQHDRLGPYDADKDGQLSGGELRRYVEQKLPNLVNFEEFAKRFDTDGDGFISQSEFDKQPEILKEFGGTRL